MSGFRGGGGGGPSVFGLATRALWLLHLLVVYEVRSPVRRVPVPTGARCWLGETPESGRTIRPILGQGMQFSTEVLAGFCLPRFPNRCTKNIVSIKEPVEHS
jgi:hypothetical protein